VEAGKAAWSDLDVLCLKAMRKEVSRRYHSVVELMQDIDRYLKGEPLKARPDTLKYRLQKFVKRNERAVVTAALVFTLVTGLIVFFTVRLAKERDRANRETAIATAINRFLSDDLLGRTDPFKSGKAQESFAEVVNRASPQIDTQFSGEPAVAARLHETIARAFDNRSDYARARQEYARANDLFQRAEGPLSQDAITVRLRWAVMEAVSGEPGSLTRAQSFVREAEKSILKISRPREDLAVLLSYARGAAAIAADDAQSANKNFAEALRQEQKTSSLDAATQARAKQMVAFSYIRLDEGAKAEPVLREVIDVYARKYGEDSPDVLRSRATLSMALMRQHKYAEAIRETDLIYSKLVAKLGEDNHVTLALLGTRAASEGYLGRWNDAIRDDLTLYGIALRKQGPGSFLSLGSLSDAALSQCRAGRYADGELNARKAFNESSVATGPRSGITGGCAYSLATCLIGLNKLDEASDLLRNIDAAATAQLSADSSVGASVALAQGEIAARRGDYVSAQRYAQQAALVFDGPNADASDQESLQKLRSTIDSHLRVSR